LIKIVGNVINKDYVQEKKRDAMMIEREGAEDNLLKFFVSTLKEINQSLNNLS